MKIFAHHAHAQGTKSRFPAQILRKSCRIAAPATGQLRRLSLTCHNGGSICGEPLYLVLRVQRGGTWQTLGVSTNAHTQQSGQVGEWLFADLSVQRGETLELQASYTADGNVADDAWVGCLVVSSTTAQCQGTNGGWNNFLICCTLTLAVTAEPVYLTADQQQKLLTLL